MLAFCYISIQNCFNKISKASLVFDSSKFRAFEFIVGIPQGQITHLASAQLISIEVSVFCQNKIAINTLCHRHIFSRVIYFMALSLNEWCVFLFLFIVVI